jgi:hypothetical protein
VRVLRARTQDGLASDACVHATRLPCHHRSPLYFSNTQSNTDTTMIRHDYSRVEHKRRANLSHKKKQFAKAEFQEQNYEHRLNFYVLPPTAEITLEEFEQWAINRLKGASACCASGGVIY